MHSPQCLVCRQTFNEAIVTNKTIFVMWLECRLLDTAVDGSNPDISMLCPCARHFIRIASVDSAVK